MKKRKKKALPSTRKKLESAMLNHYQRLNKESKEKDKKVREQAVLAKKQQSHFKIAFIIVLLAAAIASFIVYILLNLSGWIWVTIVFGIFFIMFFTIADFIISRNEERHQYNVRLIFEIVSLLLVVGQFAVMVNQTNIMAQQRDVSNSQTEILTRTSQSNYPEVLIASSWGYRSYKWENFANTSRHQLGIGITNIGRATAPFVDIRLHDTIFFGGLREYGFSTMQSLDYNLTVLTFYLYPDANLSLFAFGERDITFKVDCAMCREPVSYQNITICIYNQSSLDECGDKWSPMS